MTQHEFDSLTHPSISIKNEDDFNITLTYDLGNLEDVENFQNKLEDLEKSSGIELYSEVYEDQSNIEEKSNEEFLDWNIIDVFIDCEDITVDKFYEIVNHIDTF